MNTHRWPRATISHGNYGCICECGNLKTDQALTCKECAAVRHTPGYWDRRTCPCCNGPKSRQAAMCRPCRNDLRRGVTVVSGRPQPPDHPWRKAETLRLAA